MHDDSKFLVLRSFLFFLTALLPSCCSSQSFVIPKFDKDRITLDFKADNKLNSEIIPSIAEIQEMLDVVSSTFQHVFVYHSGTISDTPWYSSANLANGLTPVAAANLNKNRNKLALQVTVGIRILNKNEDEWELRNALESSLTANKIFPRTVVRMFMSFESNSTNDIVISWFSKLSQNEKVKIQNLTLGIYADDCDEFHSFETLRELNTSILLKFFSQVDFLACHVNAYIDQKRGIQEFEHDFGNFLLHEFYKTEDIKSNYLIDIIPVCNYASLAFSESNEFRNSVEEMVNYWQEWNDWAVKTNHNVWFYGAFDYKVDDKWFNRYGWWERLNDDSNNPSAFLEKVTVLTKFSVSTLSDEAKSTIIPIVTSSVNYTYWALGTISLVLITLIGCITLLVWRHYRNKVNLPISIESENINQRMEKKKLFSGSQGFLNNSEYEISRQNVKIDELKILGKGAFGEVFKGQIKGGDLVAVKTMAEDTESHSLNCFLSEIKVMMYVGKHENIVSFIGADTSQVQTGSIFIFLELCELGSLESYLRKNLTIFPPKHSKPNGDVDEEHTRNSDCGIHVNFNMNKLVKWSYQICCGMEHISKKKVIHADLATRNVLLTNEEVAKVTDFGLSKRLYEYANYAKSNSDLLPWRWMSIESLQSLKFTSSSDVWAFGVTLWEIFSDAHVPYAGITWTTDFTYKLKTGLRLHKPHNASEQMYLKMLHCWSLDAIERPNFQQLKEFFDEILRSQTEQIYFTSEELAKEMAI